MAQIKCFFDGIEDFDKPFTYYSEKYTIDGVLTTRCYHYTHNEGDCKYYNLHRDDGPALIYFYADGNIREEYWYNHNKKHRDNGPAYIFYCVKGNIETAAWYKDNKLHRDDGPARLIYHYPPQYQDAFVKEWYLNGKMIDPPDDIIMIKACRE